MYEIHVQDLPLFPSTQNPPPCKTAQLIIFIYEGAKEPNEEKSKEDKQAYAELSLAHLCSQARCQPRCSTTKLH